MQKSAGKIYLANDSPQGVSFAKLSISFLTYMRTSGVPWLEEKGKLKPTATLLLYYCHV